MYDAIDDPHTYENSTVLVNKLDLRDQDDLDAYETEISNAAYFLSELNAIHTFREGNGRTQLTFLAILADNAGHPLDLEALDPHVMLDAMIESFQGDEAKLVRAIRELIAE